MLFLLSLLSFLFSIPFFLQDDTIFCGEKVGSSHLISEHRLSEYLGSGVVSILRERICSFDIYLYIFIISTYLLGYLFRYSNISYKGR